MSKLEECIFCECSLEEYRYGHIEENEERAESPRLQWHTMNICKGCIKKLKILIEDAPQEASD